MPVALNQITPKLVESVALKYMQNLSAQIIKIIPALPVSQFTGQIAEYKKEDWLRIDNPDKYIREGADEAFADDFELGRVNYVLRQYGFKKYLTMKELENYDRPIDPVRDAIDFVKNRIDMAMTNKFLTSYLNTASWSYSHQGATSPTGTQVKKWSDSASDPVQDVINWKKEVEQVTGREPNKMLLSKDVFYTLQTNPAITDRMKVTDDKVVTKSLLARLFGLDELEVFGGVGTTAKKGQTADKTNTNYLLAGKALLVYTPGRPSIVTPSAGYVTYSRRRGMSTQKALAYEIRTYTNQEKNNAKAIEANAYLDFVVTAKDLGVYAYDLV